MSPLPRGFSLIEQLTMLATLGVLSATALPRLAALTQDAEVAALDNTVAALTAAMLINQGACSLAGAAQRPEVCVPLQDCRDAQALLAQPLGPDWQLQAQALPLGEQRHLGASCTLRHLPSGQALQFRGFAAGV
jgi:type II secretory pathway pseudopilin PulG